jgi:hypothetical protein
VGVKQRTGGVTLRIDRESIRTNSDGSITVPGRLTKTGIYSYKRGEDTVRELRSESEVFSADALESLRGVPVTVDHPPNFLKLDNIDDYQVGNVSFVAANPPYVDGKLRIWKEDAIHRIKQGYIKEVSCGYACVPQDVDREDCDVEQCSLDYNHVALGPESWGRLGSDVSLRLDSDGQEIITPSEALTDNEDSMSDISEALAPVLDAIKALQANHDSLKADFEAKSEEPTVDSPVTRIEKLPDAETVDSMVLQKVNAALLLELGAREAYQEVCGWRIDGSGRWERDDLYFVEPVLCGRKLCQDVLQAVDADRVIGDDDDLGPLVREAQMLGKARRQDRLAALTQYSDIREQLTQNVKARQLQKDPTFRTPKSPIDSFFGNEAKDN